MSYAQRLTLALLTDAAGDFTGYIPVVTGKIINLIYTNTDFDPGVDIAVTGDDSATNIWTEPNVDSSKTVAPRQATHDEAGVASLYAGAGEPVEDHIYVANERIKVVISNGGNAKTGSITVILA